MLAHNGEINTLRGNINWMKSHEIRMAATTFGDQAHDVKPVIQPRGSDSAALDNVFELLVRAGRSAPMAKALLIPEATAKDDTVSEANKALYAYCNAVMEPWDGPAAICATDGRWVIAGKDRNGLRPLRVTETKDGLLIVGSEAGMTGVAEERISRRIHIAPGRMIAVDLEGGRLYGEDEIIDALAAKHDYPGWLENMVELEPLIMPGAGAARLSRRGTAPPPDRRRLHAGRPRYGARRHGQGRQGSHRLDGRRYAARLCCPSSGVRWRTISARTSPRSPIRRSIPCAKRRACRSRRASRTSAISWPRTRPRPTSSCWKARS